ncbi:MAG: hypothetical protein Q8L88_02400 [Bacteroidota bacterium]|nr:hypothetical protein [Bacteroidota bacterium]
MKSETEHYQKVCTDAGVQFIEADGQFVFFQDVITKEKLSVEKTKFNNPRVQAIVTTARRKYPKDIEMLSDFTDAIRFLTNKYYMVPPRTIGDAALAATLVVQQFINEQKIISGESNEKIAA